MSFGFTRKIYYDCITFLVQRLALSLYLKNGTWYCILGEVSQNGTVFWVRYLEMVLYFG